MIHECPLEFELLKEIFGKVCIRNNVYLVESFAYSSDNPFFKTETFRKALLDYKKYGCRTPNRMPDDAERELVYIYKNIAKKHNVIETEILFV